MDRRPAVLDGRELRLRVLRVHRGGTRFLGSRISRGWKLPCAVRVLLRFDSFDLEPFMFFLHSTGRCQSDMLIVVVGLLEFDSVWIDCEFIFNAVFDHV